MSKEKRGKSLMEQVRDRVRGGDRDTGQNSFFKWPKFKREEFRETMSQEFAVLAPKEGNKIKEFWVHFFQDEDGRVHCTRCTKDRGLPKEDQRKCLVCKKVAHDHKKDDRRKAQQFFMLNVMWDGAKPYEDEESGTKKCRLYQHKWTVMEGIADLADEGVKLTGKGRQWLKVIKIRKGNPNKGERADQTSYKVKAGEVFELPSEWRKLELWDLEEFYLPNTDEEIAEWLGEGEEETREKKHKKHRVTEEDLDEDEDEEEEHKSSRKHKKDEDDDEKDEDEDVEELEEDEDDEEGY
jgi:hypothetical protein